MLQGGRSVEFCTVSSNLREKPCGKPISQASEGAEKLRTADFSAELSKFLVHNGYKGRIRSLISDS